MATCKRLLANLRDISLCAKCTPALPTVRVSSLCFCVINVASLAHYLSCDFIEKERSGSALLLFSGLSQK